MILFKVLTNGKLTLFESFFKMFKNLTWQSDKDIRHYCQPGKKYRSIILIIVEIIWVYSSFILSKSFSGLLLSTFFNMKSTPVVTTLQDIRDNSNIMPLANHGSISSLSRNHKFYIDDILIRIEEKSKFITSISKLVELVVNGQAVCLYNSIQRKRFIELASSYIDRIFVSDTKYFPSYATLLVRVNYDYTKIVEF